MAKTCLKTGKVVARFESIFRGGKSAGVVYPVSMVWGYKGRCLVGLWLAVCTILPAAHSLLLHLSVSVPASSTDNGSLPSCSSQEKKGPTDLHSSQEITSESFF
jgi:hypothetical protein